MKTGEIGDNQLKASSWKMDKGFWPPKTARYDFPPFGDYSGAWMPEDDKSTSDWYQVGNLDIFAVCIAKSRKSMLNLS